MTRFAGRSYTARVRALLLLLAVLSSPAAARLCTRGWADAELRRCTVSGSERHCLEDMEQACVGDAMRLAARMRDAPASAAAAFLEPARQTAMVLRLLDGRLRLVGGALTPLSSVRLGELEEQVTRHERLSGGAPSRGDDVTFVPADPRPTEAPFHPRKRGPQDDSAPGFPFRAMLAVGAVVLLAALGLAWYHAEGPDGEGLPEYGRPPLPGQLIAGRWKLRRRMPGSGVPRYEARDAASGEDVLVRGPIPYPVMEMHRALNEAEGAARLTHPAVKDRYEAAKDIRGVFVATDALSGQTLEDVLAKGAPLDAEFARKVLSRLAEALARLHEEKRVHGGFGPSWALLREDGTVKLRGLGPSPDPTPAPYREPGVRAPDAASDQYAWAAVAYALVTGVPPFGGADGEELKAVPGGCPSPARHRAGLPPALDSFFRRALDPDPSNRFSDMKEAANAFESCWKKGDRPLA